jgi:DNA modification methylase
MTDWLNKTHVGDCRALLPAMAAAGVRAQTCVTSPPYFGLRDYGVAGQIGLEASPDEYVEGLVNVFRLVREVLADDGTLWLNLGDSYSGHASGAPQSRVGERSTLRGNGHTGGGPKLKSVPRPRRGVGPGTKSKDLLGIPWRVAFALQADGWWLRSDVVWHKPNPMPESVTDRPTKAHEYLFLLAKSERYFYDAEASKEPAVGEANSVTERVRNVGGRTDGFSRGCPWSGSETRNRRTVWTIPTSPFAGAHFATFPRALVEPCVLSTSRSGDIVLDPFMGSGTVAQVATDLGRAFIGCELNPDYIELHNMRRTTIGMPI